MSCLCDLAGYSPLRISMYRSGIQRDNVPSSGYHAAPLPGVLPPSKARGDTVTTSENTPAGQIHGDGEDYKGDTYPVGEYAWQ